MVKEVVLGPWRQRCAAGVKLRDPETKEYLRNEDGSVRTRPCKNWATPGSTVCRMHGSGGSRSNPDSPAAKVAAKLLDRRESIKRRLEELGEQALETVSEILAKDGAKESDRLKAAEMVLDRIISRKIEAESSRDELDLDAEIEEALGDIGLAATGTEGAGDEEVDDDGGP